MKRSVEGAWTNGGKASFSLFLKLQKKFKFKELKKFKKYIMM
jgi:hypothetical protein